MSIEVDPPLQLEHYGEQYHIYPFVNEEFREQIDFVRIVRLRDQCEVACITPSQATNELHTTAVALAKEVTNQLEWEPDGLVIDHFDTEEQSQWLPTSNFPQR